MKRILPMTIAFMLFVSNVAQAQPENFHKGALIPEFGPVATIEGYDPIPEETIFKVSFDVVERAEAGQLNPKLISAARFLNMHTEAGVPADHISLAIVIHGSAVQDITNADHFGEGHNKPNANEDLIAKLIKNGVEIHVCGQSAAYQGVTLSDLLPGERMSLSATTAHALLQQDGYILNPF